MRKTLTRLGRIALLVAPLGAVAIAQQAPPPQVAIQEIVDGLNRELSQYERIKRIALLPREFTVESGELTPTLKIKRKVVEEKWKEQIEGLYRE